MKDLKEGRIGGRVPIYNPFNSLRDRNHEKMFRVHIQLDGNLLHLTRPNLLWRDHQPGVIKAGRGIALPTSGQLKWGTEVEQIDFHT